MFAPGTATSNSTMYIYSGTAAYVSTTPPASDLAHWAEFSAPAGAKGEKGDTGAAGPQGPKGDKGEKGDTGDTADLSVPAPVATDRSSVIFLVFQGGTPMKLGYDALKAWLQEDLNFESGGGGDDEELPPGTYTYEGDYVLTEGNYALAEG